MIAQQHREITLYLNNIILHSNEALYYSFLFYSMNNQFAFCSYLVGAIFGRDLHLQ